MAIPLEPRALSRYCMRGTDSVDTDTVKPGTDTVKPGTDTDTVRPGTDTELSNLSLSDLALTLSDLALIKSLTRLTDFLVSFYRIFDENIKKYLIPF